MSGISATVPPLSCPSKLNPNTNFPRNPYSKSSISSHFSNQTRNHSFRTHCSSRIPTPVTNHHLFSSASSFSGGPSNDISRISHSGLIENLVLIDLDPGTAKLAIAFLGPFLSAFGFLFIVRIVMSWYPKLPVDKFPYVIAYAPTEPLLIQTRKVIPPLAGVDVTPVVWFGLLSFLNEILVGPQGLLVLLSQQV